MHSLLSSYPYLFFFFNDTATTEIYTLSLHDALPILALAAELLFSPDGDRAVALTREAVEIARRAGDRKSTRLNSSHVRISYAVFCLKKKKQQPCTFGAEEQVSSTVSIRARDA